MVSDEKQSLDVLQVSKMSPSATIIIKWTIVIYLTRRYQSEHWWRVKVYFRVRYIGWVRRVFRVSLIFCGLFPDSWFLKQVSSLISGVIPHPVNAPILSHVLIVNEHYWNNMWTCYLVVINGWILFIAGILCLSVPVQHLTVMLKWIDTGSAHIVIFFYYKYFYNTHIECERTICTYSYIL